MLFMHFYLSRAVRYSYMNSLRDGLAAQVRLAADSVPETESDVAGYCTRAGSITGAQVTVIDLSGHVLCDSAQDPASMENLDSRPEFQQALASPVGFDVRKAGNNGSNILYTARMIGEHGIQRGFIRLASDLGDADRAINGLITKIYLTTIAAFLFLGMIIIRQTSRIRNYVTRTAEHAGALAHGLFKKKLYIEGAGEFTELAHNLNAMSSELEASIRTSGEETNRLSVIIRNIPDALLLINTRGIIEIANKAASELFDTADLEGKPFIEEVRSPEFASLIDNVRSNRVAGSAELVLEHPAEIFLTVRVAPLYYEIGKLSGLVAIFHDTTMVKKLEQVRKDFVTNVSHEIRTPVTAIAGFAETLLDGALYDRENAEKFLRTIHAHSRRLNRLVEDLLTISKIELGVITINSEAVDLTEIINSVTDTMILQAAEKQLNLKKNTGQRPVMVRADRDRTMQILLNILDNAIKFTDSGEIETGISQEGGRTAVYVKDTGCGIPEQLIPRIGERFFRVNASRSRAPGGTGLGMAIVKHLVRAQGWEMQIASREGSGTTVTILVS